MVTQNCKTKTNTEKILSLITQVDLTKKAVPYYETALIIHF
jgi:hypothetical protein